MTKKLPKIIVAGLVKRGNKYLLIKEKLSDGTDYWIVPGGTVEFGESLQKSLIREMKEETNLDISSLKYLTFKEAIFPDHNYHTIIFFYLLKAKKGEVRLESKILEYGYFSLDEIKKLRLVDSAEWLFKKIDFSLHSE